MLNIIVVRWIMKVDMRWRCWINADADADDDASRIVNAEC